MSFFHPLIFAILVFFSSILDENHGFKSMILDARFMEIGILRGSILKKIKVRKKASFYPPKMPYLEWFSATFGDFGGSFNKNYYAISGFFINSIQILLIFEGHFWNIFFILDAIIIFCYILSHVYKCAIFESLNCSYF